MDRVKVILFSRYPMPGKSKTRLIPSVGESGASYCQVVMTEKLLTELRFYQIEVWYAGGDKDLMKYWLDRKHSITLKEQVPGGLGEKIAGAFDSAFKEGFEKVLIVGADIPGLSGNDLDTAVSALNETGMVLQPAIDGGYVLVGLCKKHQNDVKALFCSGTINWGKETVLAEQLEAAKTANVICNKIGTPLSDVDTIEELPVFVKATGVTIQALKEPLTTIVAPVVNEQDSIKEVITNWMSQSDHPDRLNITICDGGSTDGTIAAVESLNLQNVNIVRTSKGRGNQIAHGIESSTGDVVIMVHADTFLPKSFDSIALKTLRTPGVSAGAFSFSVNSTDWRMRLVEQAVNWRSGSRELPYGDQALFSFRRTIDSVGGVSKDHPLLEDLDLVKKLTKNGHVVTVPETVITSPRRWQDLGIVKVTVVNQLVLFSYLYLKVPPATLSSWYYGGAQFWWLFAAIPLLLLLVLLQLFL
eukprot:TRINITY_DN10049_c0_g1_i3.p1 TRINITY_DN10049_c0_g1~~TRINITY_DN10049_c0_g1_i3.p1  ORF type:complete len:486 (+),score=76.68 TRINITY_DN10049_c0_g1_i3:44-1459(+)